MTYPVIAAIATILLGSVAPVASLPSCSSASTCSDCISLPYSCVWCYQTLGVARCLSPQDSESCSDILFYSSNISEIDDLPISDQNQVSLQSISLKLRVNESIDVKVRVKASNDYPLDLYILMDLSASFSNDLDNVKNIAPQLPLSLRSVSSDFQIGFGAFVDKPTLPYVSNRHLRYPPEVVNIKTTPFGYEHIVSLTNSSNLFNSTLQDIQISTNADNPEGTLDAMLQAAVCDHVVEWRQDSRKILLVMTDDVIHTAGDGTLAGIVKPNDGLCHTEYDESTNKILYKASLLQDYPSMELVRVALSNDDIIPVFAVASDRRNIISFYNESVGPLLNGFTVRLDDDSANLVSVLSEAYRRVVSNARLNFNVPDHISASVTANCSNYSPETRECIEIGDDIVEFTISLNLKQCTQELKDGKSDEITVNIPGFSHFLLKISGQCSCECEFETISESIKCSKNGNLTCGLCDCKKGWKGSNCSCSTLSCPVGLNGKTCNGRGVCECGECNCNDVSSLANSTGVDEPLIYGTACECSNFECPTDSNGEVCSGMGECSCNNGTYECLCEERRTGDWCQCSTDHCINGSNSSRSPCNGNGVCNPCQPEGRACTCDNSYRGPYCEESTTMSGSGSCARDDSIRDCVICYGEAAETGNSAMCESMTCEGFTLLTASPSDQYEIPGSLPDSNTDCSFINGLCSYTYIAGKHLDGGNLYTVPPRSCSNVEVAIVMPILILIIGVFVLIVIKVITVILGRAQLQRELRRKEGTRDEQLHNIKLSRWFCIPTLVSTNSKKGERDEIELDTQEQVEKNYNDFGFSDVLY